jgi:hypothetical protein
MYLCCICNVLSLHDFRLFGKCSPEISHEKNGVCTFNSSEYGLFVIEITLSRFSCLSMTIDWVKYVSEAGLP